MEASSIAGRAARLVACVGITALVAAAAQAQQSAPVVTAESLHRDGSAVPAQAPARVPMSRASSRIAARQYEPIKPSDDRYSILEVDMFVGESRVFPAPNIGRIAVGNGGIMTAAALDDREVIVFANAVGTSSLFVWNKDGRYQKIKINIVAGDTTRVQRDVAMFLSQIPSAKASVVGDQVIVEGDNLSDTDRLKIAKIAEKYPQVVNFTDPTGWEKMIMMDVKVVEFPTSVLRDIGVNWGNPQGAIQGGVAWYPTQRNAAGVELTTPNAQITGAGGMPLSLPQGAVILGGLNLVLNAQVNLLAQKGEAVILAEPILSARNGTEATFLAGGEIPFQGASATGTPFIQFKEYGVKLNITPRADNTGTILAKIATSVTDIDPKFSSASGPAFTKRETNTTFNVKDGQTIVLSGFLKRNQGSQVDKLPLLGDLPVLGPLFRSKRFSDDQTELVIFVTPSVVSAGSPGLRDRVERTTQRLQKTFGPQPFLSDPIQPGADMGKPAVTVAPASEPIRPDAASDAGAARPAAPTDSMPLLQTAAAKPDGRAFFTANRPADRDFVRYRVTRDGVPMRLSADINAQTVLTLSEGAVAERLPQPGQGNWTPVQVGDARGWVESEWLQLIRSNR